MLASRSLAFVIGCVLLASCGSDDSGSPPPTGGGTPTPSPSPSPTPTYATFATLTGDQAFATACGGTSGADVVQAVGFGRAATNSPRLSLDFTAANSNWRIVGTSVTGEPFDNTFRPEDIDAASTFTNFTDYLRDPGTGFRNRLLLGDKPIAGITREYVRQFVHVVRPTANSVPSTYFCTYGIPTLLTDPLPTSTISYTSFRLVGQGVIQGGPQGGAYDLGESTVTLSANPANGQVSTRLVLTGRLQTPTGLSDTRVDLGTYAGVAQVDGTTQNYFAVLDGETRQIVGFSNFGGWFFGPQGREAGFGFSIQAAQQTGERLQIAGSVTARR
jgi:hypothetical protein